MTTLYLIRHGQASFGQQNYDNLSALGHQQATLLGKSFTSRLKTFDNIILGSMLRHKQTRDNCIAELTQPDGEDVIDAGWNEYDHHDILAQMGPEFKDALSIETWVRQQPNPKKAFEKLFNDAMNRWMSGEYDNQYVESWSHYHQRIISALNNAIANNQACKRVAIFTSGGPISVVSQHLLGVPATRVMQVNWTLVNCGITKVVSTHSRRFLSSLNEHAHFEGLDSTFITYK